MKKILGRPRLQRIFVASAHGQFRDTFRKSIQLVSRRMNKYRLKFPYMMALEVTNECLLDCIMCPRTKRKEGPGAAEEGKDGHLQPGGLSGAAQGYQEDGADRSELPIPASA